MNERDVADGRAPRDIRDRLAGRWHVVESTFPMWLSGKRRAPAFTYTRAERNGRDVLLDDVSWRDARGRERHLHGVDTLDVVEPRDGREAGAFVWRGSGVLALVTSRWRVVLLDDASASRDDHVAVIAFTRTIFTPAGLDVVTRAPALAATARARVVDALRRARVEGVDALRPTLP